MAQQEITAYQAFSVDFGQFPARMAEIESKFEILEKHISVQIMPMMQTHNTSGIAFAKPQQTTVLLINGLILAKKKSFLIDEIVK